MASSNLNLKQQKQTAHLILSAIVVLQFFIIPNVIDESVPSLKRMGERT